MVAIANKHRAVFKGMGRAKIDPIHIQMKDEITPIAQGKCPIHFRHAVHEKLQYMKENGLVEGPLAARECRGWIHNMLIMRKSWSNDEVPINVDTK